MVYKIALPEKTVQTAQSQLIASVRFLPVLFEEGEIVIKLDKAGAKVLFQHLTHVQRVAFSAQLYALTDEVLRSAIYNITESPDSAKATKQAAAKEKQDGHDAKAIKTPVTSSM